MVTANLVLGLAYGKDTCKGWNDIFVVTTGYPEVISFAGIHLSCRKLKIFWSLAANTSNFICGSLSRARQDDKRDLQSARHCFCCWYWRAECVPGVLLPVHLILSCWNNMKLREFCDEEWRLLRRRQPDMPGISWYVRTFPRYWLCKQSEWDTLSVIRMRFHD